MRGDLVSARHRQLRLAWARRHLRNRHEDWGRVSLPMSPYSNCGNLMDAAVSIAEGGLNNDACLKKEGNLVVA